MDGLGAVCAFYVALFLGVIRMADMDGLLKEAEKLGILNIDVNSEQLSPQAIQAAIDATKSLNSRLDRNAVKSISRKMIYRQCARRSRIEKMQLFQI